MAAKKQTPKKTSEIVLSSIKDPDTWGELIHALKLPASKAKKHFDCSEYASLELTIDEDLNIIGGRILRLDE